MSSFEEMNKVLSEQKDFFIKNGSPSVELRIDRLQRLKSLIMDNRYDFVDALNTDFGNRSNNASMLSDVYGIMPAINLAIKNVKKWSKPEKKFIEFSFWFVGSQIIRKIRATWDCWYDFTMELSCKFNICTSGIDFRCG